MMALLLLGPGCRTRPDKWRELRGDSTNSRVVATNPMPFDLEDGHVIVPVVLNGHEVRLVLDTGASHIGLSAGAAAAAGIGTTTKMSFGTFGDARAKAGLGVAESVAVGPAIAEKVPVAVIPVPPVFEDGLFGLSFLRHFNFRLDYERKTVSFTVSTNAFADPAGSAIPMTDDGPDGLLTVWAEVDGLPAKLIVDTGAGAALMLRPWFVEKHGLRQRYPKRLSMVTGGNVLGLMHGEMLRLQSLRLGDHVLTGEFVEFQTGPDSQHEDIAGYLGGGILNRFNLTFDFAGRRLWLEPHSNNRLGPPPQAPVRSGLACRPDGVVEDVIPDSPAAEAGVLRGDRLLKINGVSVPSLKFEDLKRALRAEPGTRVRLQLQTDGREPREVTLILRDLI
jgi:clan AA aspartic protease (TIGR02281 family)